MANIAISDLCPIGSNLFQDSESFLNELSDVEINSTHGGSSPACILIGVGAIVSLTIATHQLDVW